MAVNIRLWHFLFYHTLPIESVTHKTVFLFRVCSPFKAHSNPFILSLFVQSYLKKLAPLCLLISRTHEGRKGAETPASETPHGFQSSYPPTPPPRPPPHPHRRRPPLVFSPLPPPPPPPPNLLTWQRCINLKQESDPKGKITLVFFVISAWRKRFNFEFGANTTNMLTQVPSRLSSTFQKDAAIFVLINDRDFDNETPIFYPSPLQLTHTLLVSLLYFL